MIHISNYLRHLSIFIPLADDNTFYNTVVILISNTNIITTL